MEDKLKNLTEQLYKDGLEKGNQEAQKIIEDAKQEAKRIVEQAENEANEKRQSTEKELDNKKRKTDSEIQMIGKQIISKVKNDITTLITLDALDKSLKENFNQTDFLQKLILAVVQNWSKTKEIPLDLSVVLPENLKSELNEFVTSNCSEQLKNGLEVDFSTDVLKGVKVGPKDSRYMIDLTDESFIEFFAEHLRPMTKELLFKNESN